MTPTPRIAAIAPYALADLSPGLVSLAQNESLRPPSPKALEAARAAMADTALYPDPDWSDLCAAIAEVHALPPDSAILCGAGSMELIGALATAYLSAGDRMLTTELAYLYARTATQIMGAAVDLAPEQDFTVDADALLDAVRPDTKIVFVANPGNPTGTRIGRAELARLRQGLPGDVMLVIDEAYGEFATPQEHSFDLVERGSTVILRTLSKAYGCAGSRVGWGVFPPAIAAEVRKVLNPNNISGVSQAMATAALRDQAYMLDTVHRTATIRDRFITRLRALGLRVPDSHANFTLIVFASPDHAQAADRALRAEGMAMRGMGGYGLPYALRATIAEDQVMQRAAQCLERFIGEQR